mmetsp:Transcript_127297/g.291092  ORF Transcript_127297/g.291092 Transcript_127297/m.291092 type:complete len:80 (-) Transcript_127297:261-500(-)
MPWQSDGPWCSELRRCCPEERGVSTEAKRRASRSRGVELPPRMPAHPAAKFQQSSIKEEVKEERVEEVGSPEKEDSKIF